MSTYASDADLAAHLAVMNEMLQKIEANHDAIKECLVEIRNMVDRDPSIDVDALIAKLDVILERDTPIDLPDAITTGL